MTKSGYIEYKMPREMAEAILKSRKGNDPKENQIFLCKVVNEQFGLKGYCTKVHVY